MIAVEKRQMERFSLELPASLSMKDESGKQKAFELMTRNICAGGAFLLTDKPLSVGTSFSKLSPTRRVRRMTTDVWI